MEFIGATIKILKEMELLKCFLAAIGVTVVGLGISLLFLRIFKPSVFKKSQDINKIEGC